MQPGDTDDSQRCDLIHCVDDPDPARGASGRAHLTRRKKEQDRPELDRRRYVRWSEQPLGRPLILTHQQRPLHGHRRYCRRRQPFFLSLRPASSGMQTFRRQDGVLTDWEAFLATSAASPLKSTQMGLWQGSRSTTSIPLLFFPCSPLSCGRTARSSILVCSEELLAPQRPSMTATKWSSALNVTLNSFDLGDFCSEQSTAHLNASFCLAARSAEGSGHPGWDR